MENPKTGSSNIWIVKYIGILAIVLGLCSEGKIIEKPNAIHLMEREAS
jgi:hypothetical protein